MYTAKTVEITKGKILAYITENYIRGDEGGQSSLSVRTELVTLNCP